ncbi:glycosyltransferase [Haliscomenobacter sp.]|uniref:glycosyltransferase n=1 Tax=Haliscomenobacter sp. TaxID=2717303 RepID=UPI003364E6FE
MTDKPVSLIGKVTSPLHKIFPTLHYQVWNRQRDKIVKSQLPSLAEFAAPLTIASQDSQRDLHVIVIPHYGPDAPTWHVAGQNHFFEIYQSLQEILGPERVTLLATDKSDPNFDYHARLMQLIIDTKATHVVGQIESDPNKADTWSWDVPMTMLANNWGGVFIGVMWDWAYPWLSVRAKRLAGINSRLLVAELCQPISGLTVKGRIEAGPMTMPLSRATTSAILDRVAGAEKIYDLTFIGALYDYRVQLIDQLRADGVNVAVNPHRPDVTTDYHESRSNQPSYLDYMYGLAQSQMTINFSQAAGGPGEQYKIRLQEAALAQCLCLTDDRNRTRHFFAPDQFGFFDELSNLEHVVKDALSNPVELKQRQIAAQARALKLAETDFWGRIEEALSARGLRSLTGLTAPPEPISN